VRGKFDPIPEQYSKEMKNLISEMLNVKPDKRPSVHEILKTPIVTNRIK
jgi:NIMA (never in mitosis gene a)-related kinase 1/4/5